MASARVYEIPWGRWMHPSLGRKAEEVVVSLDPGLSPPLTLRAGLTAELVGSSLSQAD